MARNRKKFEEYVLDVMGKLTKGGGNRTIYERLFKAMDDKQFDAFIEQLENGRCLSIWLSNYDPKEMLVFEDLLKLAKQEGFEIEQQLIIYDDETGIKTMTAHKAIVGIAEVRKQRQMLIKKFSAATNDNTIDDLTGQVTGDSRSTGISQPEITVLRNLGLNIMANELYNVKGGDQAALKAYKNDLLTTGRTTTNGSLRKGDIPKVLKTAHYLMRGRLLDNNFHLRNG